MGKSTISLVIFNSKLLVYQRVTYIIRHNLQLGHQLVRGDRCGLKGQISENLGDLRQKTGTTLDHGETW